MTGLQQCAAILYKLLSVSDKCKHKALDTAACMYSVSWFNDKKKNTLLDIDAWWHKHIL